MAVVRSRDERLVFRSDAAAMVASGFRNVAAGMHGKVKDSYAEGRVMACAIGEERQKKDRSRFPVGSGTLTESEPGGCPAEILSCAAIALEHDSFHCWYSEGNRYIVSPLIGIADNPPHPTVSDEKLNQLMKYLGWRQL